MSRKDKFVDSPDCSKNDKDLEFSSENLSLESLCKTKTSAEGRINEKPDEDITKRAFASEHIEQARSCLTLGNIPLSEININQMTISRKGSADGVNNGQPEIPQCKISKCFEAVEYFSGECSSLGSSSNSKSSEPPGDPNIVVEEIPSDNGDGFVELLYNVIIQDKDLVDLMTKIRSNHYTVSEYPEELVFSNCKGLFEKDYDLEIVDNYGGNLSSHYPERVIIPTKRKGESVKEINFDNEVYTQLVKSSTGARCRARFVAPVILFDNKFICRSGTLSVRKGAFFETATKAEPPQEIYVEDSLLQACSRRASYLTSSILHRAKSAGEAALNLITSDSMERMKDLDKQILKTLKLEFICDLMIEDRKMYRQAISVSSSEKVNRDIYSEFKIEQMPYPGCEFFRRYHFTGREAKGLIFNWDREWDITELTKNYLKVLLSRLLKGKGGLLIHCISGWDRTPLIISLLRVSLWADKVIHQNLEMKEIVYLTLAYDWYLFGHNFPARMSNREEILHYCFDFLPSIANDEFSITKMFEKLPFYEKYNRTFPAFNPGCREVLNELSRHILEIYNEVVTQYYRW